MRSILFDAREDGYADLERPAVGGLSCGGALTNDAITNSNRLAAAISDASEILHHTNHGTITTSAIGKQGSACPG